MLSGSEELIIFEERKCFFKLLKVGCESKDGWI
jgi:hypothetical protein